MRRWVNVGLVALICWSLALWAAETPTARPWGGCTTIALTGVVRDVACSPVRCFGTLTEGGGRAYAVRSRLGKTWREGQEVTATWRVCR